jgi:ABC-2 type transport system ATP-binding protein
VDELVKGASGSGVFVRTGKLTKLENLLKSKYSVEKLEGGLKIAGAKTDEIGHLAFEAGIPLLELTNHSASLEDAFLEITADSQEYKTGGNK